MTKLANGITVASRETSLPYSKIGVFIKSGSRSETYSQKGLTRALAHSAFLVIINFFNCSIRLKCTCIQCLHVHAGQPKGCVVARVDHQNLVRNINIKYKNFINFGNFGPLCCGAWNKLPLLPPSW